MDHFTQLEGKNKRIKLDFDSEYIYDQKRHTHKIKTYFTSGPAEKFLYWSFLNHEKEWINLVLMRLQGNENNHKVSSWK